MRIELNDAYILHVRAYQDSSALLECLSSQHGLVSLIAKGVKRPKSRFYGVIQPFILLQLSWVGRSELKTLTQAEAKILYPRINRRKNCFGSVFK